MKYYWSINKVPFYFFLFLYLIYTSWSKLLLDFKDLKYKWSTLNNFFCKRWLLFECVHLTKWYQYIFSTSSKVWSILHHRPVGQGHVIKMLPLMLSYTFQVFFCFSKKNLFFFCFLFGEDYGIVPLWKEIIWLITCQPALRGGMLKYLKKVWKKNYKNIKNKFNLRRSISILM